MRPIILFLGILAVSGCGLKKHDDPGPPFANIAGTYAAHCVLSNGVYFTNGIAFDSDTVATIVNTGQVFTVGTSNNLVQYQLHRKDDGSYYTDIRNLGTFTEQGLLNATATRFTLLADVGGSGYGSAMWDLTKTANQ